MADATTKTFSSTTALPTSMTVWTFPESHQAWCREFHFYYTCGHRYQEMTKDGLRNKSRIEKHGNHLLSCSIRGCKILHLNEALSGPCNPDCPGSVPVPKDDLHRINDLQVQREQEGDARLNEKDRFEVQRRRKERQDRAAAERAYLRQQYAKQYAHKLGKNGVIYERF